MNDTALARAIAADAGALLLKIRAEGRETGTALGARGDAEANALILARLRAARPDDAILSEEAADDRARLAAARVWIVDPLDGTREYSEARDDWAVHVGLAIEGRAATGAVAIPAAGQLHGGEGPRLFAPLGRPRIVVSRSRAAEVTLAAARAVDGEVVPMGSAGAKAMAVVTGAADAYLHAGGQHEWDNCAPVAVARDAGLHASRLDGSPLRYNNSDTHVPDLLICRPELAGPLIDAVARALRI